jgi:MFS family permease
MASLKEPGLLPVWWIASVFFIALGALFIFLKTYVMSRSIGSVGGFFTAYTVVAIALRIGLGWLPDRVGPIRILVPALLALSAGFFVLAGASTSRDVVAAGVLCGIGHGYTFPILFGLVVRRARDSERGSAMAIYTGLSDLGIVIAGPVFGGLLERWSYGVLFGSAAGVVLLGTALFVPWNARLPTELAER